MFAVKQATSVIPIVFATVADPLSTGLVASLARPGGNVTGLSLTSPELAGNASNSCVRFPRPSPIGDNDQCRLSTRHAGVG